MEGRTRASAVDPTTNLLREPDPSVEGRATANVSSIPSACPMCGSADLLSEAALDEDGMATGLVLVTCVVCGRELGELAPPAPGLEAEPEMAEGSLLPGPSEQPRGPSASSTTHVR